ncbi:MAG: manganese efflux pump MntP family protein [Candidatus Marinimicrobia bacterium]|nr:manganese efflux pump MntP family protein [Candidatus Neomarinimicrobiota bacterium]MCF7840790.1 manganese efflux pump MntP family protein [Candidatus Neomarinimicrobiota bacterium]MCF7902688.1 manganese efflux pump MntP family protein [Candidatus Neomarinimicrobiota bacterium]
MDGLTILLISISLAMDAFAVSLASGCSHPRFRWPDALLMALFFGCFQAGMPVIGWYGGTHLQKMLAPLDHWIAFTLLALIGGHMIYQALWDHSDSPGINPFSFKILTGLAIATSIDALVVGVTLALIQTPILLPVISIGVVTFIFSVTGVYLGRQTGRRFGSRFEILGGLILIGLGVKILIEHLTM